MSSNFPNQKFKILKPNSNFNLERVTYKLISRLNEHSDIASYNTFRNNISKTLITNVLNISKSLIMSGNNKNEPNIQENVNHKYPYRPDSFLNNKKRNKLILSKNC
jgi:hypothetical protein